MLSDIPGMFGMQNMCLMDYHRYVLVVQTV